MPRYIFPDYKNYPWNVVVAGKNDIIPEESEFEEVDENQSEKSYVTDSCLEEEQEDVGPYDENSLKFERDLDKHPEEG